MSLPPPPNLPHGGQSPSDEPEEVAVPDLPGNYTGASWYGQSAKPRDPFNNPPLGFTLRPFHINDLTRSAIVLVLLGMLLLTILFVFVAFLIHPDATDNMLKVLQVILPVEAGFLGGAIGYYFGAHSAKTS